MVGRPRTPTALKVLQGNPGKRKKDIETNEPKPQIGVPEAPKDLDPSVKEAWDHWAPILVSHGLLSIVDGMPFRGMLTAYVKALKADEVLFKTAKQGGGFTIKTSTGTTIQRPEVSISATCWKLVKDFCTEFGLTPASRSRINLQIQGPQVKSDNQKRDEFYFGNTSAG